MNWLLLVVIHLIDQNVNHKAKQYKRGEYLTHFVQPSESLPYNKETTCNSPFSVGSKILEQNKTCVMLKSWMTFNFFKLLINCFALIRCHFLQVLSHGLQIITPVPQLPREALSNGTAQGTMQADNADILYGIRPT